MTRLKNRKLERQQFAFDQFIALDSSYKENFKTFIERMGMMLYTNGLISTVAFIRSRRFDRNENETEFKYVYDFLNNWLREDRVIVFKLGETEDLLEMLLELDNSRTHLAITKELLLVSDAFKEIVKAES